MAGGGGGGGDKRSSNAEVNLVPYIDLLSTLICFLLITAVWQQVNVITTNSAITPPSEDSFNPNPDLPKDEKVQLSVKIFENYIETSASETKTSLNHLSGQIDKNKFKTILKEWKKTYPEQQDITINSEAIVPYKYLIETMDVLIEENYTGLAINTN